MYVGGNASLDSTAATVVVVEQSSSQAKTAKDANGIVVPAEKFNAAKEAFRKADPMMHPDLAEAFRAVFGDSPK